MVQRQTITGVVALAAAATALLPLGPVRAQEPEQGGKPAPLSGEGTDLVPRGRAQLEGGYTFSSSGDQHEGLSLGWKVKLADGEERFLLTRLGVALVLGTNLPKGAQRSFQPAVTLALGWELGYTDVCEEEGKRLGQFSAGAVLEHALSERVGSFHVGIGLNGQRRNFVFGLGTARRW